MIWDRAGALGESRSETSEPGAVRVQIPGRRTPEGRTPERETSHQLSEPGNRSRRRDRTKLAFKRCQQKAVRYLGTPWLEQPSHGTTMDAIP